MNRHEFVSVLAEHSAASSLQARTQSNSEISDKERPMSPLNRVRSITLYPRIVEGERTLLLEAM